MDHRSFAYLGGRSKSVQRYILNPGYIAMAVAFRREPRRLMQQLRVGSLRACLTQAIVNYSINFNVVGIARLISN